MGEYLRLSDVPQGRYIDGIMDHALGPGSLAHSNTSLGGHLVFLDRTLVGNLCRNHVLGISKY